MADDSELQTALREEMEDAPQAHLACADVMLSAAEADDLPFQQRRLCVPVADTNQLALNGGKETTRPRVIVRLPKTATGGERPATLDVERVGKQAVRINLSSASGIRKSLHANSVPEQHSRPPHR